jgi:hypothetical protein
MHLIAPQQNNNLTKIRFVFSWTMQWWQFGGNFLCITTEVFGIGEVTINQTIWLICLDFTKILRLLKPDTLAGNKRFLSSFECILENLPNYINHISYIFYCSSCFQWPLTLRIWIVHSIRLLTDTIYRNAYASYHAVKNVKTQDLKYYNISFQQT